MLRVLTALIALLTALPCVAAEQRVLVLGAIHDDPNSKYEQVRPIADYIETALADSGIESVEILIVPDRGQMVSLLRDGRIDWVSETPFGAAYLKARTNADFLARRWKDGAASYRSVFFARNDSDIESVEDLRDKIIAFEHRNSTSGFFLPASMMTERQLTLDALGTPRETPKAETFGYVYSGNEYNTAMWVHKGIAHAGVLSDSDWGRDDVIPPAFRDDMRVFETSEELPRAVELVRADLDPAIAKALRQALLSMHESDEAGLALATYDQTARFDLLSDDCIDALNSVIAQLPNFVQQFP
ncbi:MAG: phosphate/phosphite/phosphonate ABC transporter substrate-binding protein [Pseudomonadota bacterium]